MLISFVVTAKLVGAFVFAYADCWFSHMLATHMFSCLAENGDDDKNGDCEMKEEIDGM